MEPPRGALGFAVPPSGSRRAGSGWVQWCWGCSLSWLLHPEAGLCTPRFCLGTAHLWDLVAAPTRGGHLLSPGNLKTVLCSCSASSGGQGRAKLASRLSPDPPGSQGGPGRWRQSRQWHLRARKGTEAVPWCHAQRMSVGWEQHLCCSAGAGAGLSPIRAAVALGPSGVLLAGPYICWATPARGSFAGGDRAFQCFFSQQSLNYFKDCAPPTPRQLFFEDGVVSSITSTEVGLLRWNR